MSDNGKCDRGVRYDELRVIIEEWAYENNICVYPEALATDAANYVFDQLLAEAGVI
jgi:hypothetical protein